MEFITSSAAAWAAEKAAETSALQESLSQSFELHSKVAELGHLPEMQPNEPTLEALDGILNQDRYKKLAHFREFSATDPEAARAMANDIQVKGQLGESLMEARLSAYGEVKSQVPVQVEGAPTSNRIDLQLLDSDANLKQTELGIEDGSVLRLDNYDVMRGDSASFEVKNGSLPYLQQELASGELQQQIAAGKRISDYSFVVINEDTARAILSRPDAGASIIQMIQDAGGRLIVGLPEQAVQTAIFLS